PDTPLSFYYPEVTGGEVDGIDQALELLQALIHLEVFDLNISLVNSLVPHRVRLVHIEEVLHQEIISQDEEGDNWYGENFATEDFPDLTALANPTDNIMDLIHVTRDAFGADFVHLITQPPFEDPDVAGRFLPRQICGIAYIRSTLDNFAGAAFG